MGQRNQGVMCLWGYPVFYQAVAGGSGMKRETGFVDGPVFAVCLVAQHRVRMRLA